MKRRDRQRGWGWALALMSAVLPGCFRDSGPGLCQGFSCGGATGSTDASTTGTSGEPTSSTGSTAEPGTSSTGESTTGGVVDRSVTFRLDTLTFIDPHLFLTADDACANDVTGFVNGVLNDDAKAGKFNLLARFEDFGVIQEMRIVDADCEASMTPGGRWLCTPNPQAVLLATQRLDEGGCSELDPAHYQASTVPEIHDPQAPCMRSKPVDFSIPISKSVGVLSLREAQFAARFDDGLDPQRLEDGLLYGFLPKAAAEGLEFEVALFGKVNLWSLIDSPLCEPEYPEFLPSIDFLEIGGVEVPGVWLAINFTAERVDYVLPP